MGDGKQQLLSGRHQANDLDFHAFGLSGQALCPEGRAALITVDFEAFDAFSAPMWSHAMRCWADACGPAAIPTCFFVALEDVAKLRAAAPRRYRDFTDAIQLGRGWVRLLSHNHGIFDPETETFPRARWPSTACPGVSKTSELLLRCRQAQRARSCRLDAGTQRGTPPANERLRVVRPGQAGLWPRWMGQRFDTEEIAATSALYMRPRMSTTVARRRATSVRLDGGSARHLAATRSVSGLG